jgi:microsomal triglyceride transfer protein large subunit
MIEKAFIQDTKDSSLNNFVKSILSLFQYQLIDTERSEKDISGTCQVKYVVKSSTKFAKVKTECSSDSEISERLDVPLGAKARFTRVNYITTSTEGELSSIHSSDHHSFTVNGYPNVGFKMGSLFYVKHEGVVKECEVLKLDDIKSALNALKNSLAGYTEVDLSPNVDEEVGESNVS